MRRAFLLLLLTVAVQGPQLLRPDWIGTEAFRALVDAQEAGAFNLPNTMNAVKNKNSLVLDSRSRSPNKLGDPSAGVLPTSAAVNPSLTIAALALRAAAHIRDRIAA